MIAGATLMGALACAYGDAPSAPKVDEDGTAHVAAFAVPFSSFASPRMRQAFVEELRTVDEIYAQARVNPQLLSQLFDEKFYAPLISLQQARYKVDTQVTPIAGVYAETFTPAEGVSPRNKHRVLINLHGGGFIIGARTGGKVESIPIAATGRIKVVSIDYRQLPQHRFPAASEDLAAVYRALLKDYRPENIGIYGCSAGGYLTAQSIGWLEHVGLPKPGAIGVLGGGAATDKIGLSRYTGAVLHGKSIPAGGVKPLPTVNAYYSTARPDDPLANPLLSPALVKAFPPTLIANGTQDLNWSESTHLHNQLVKAGVDAQLHLWEGGNHCFMYNPEIPEARDAYDVIVKFFDRHLAT
jgi:acetyl esterase/lipase